MLAKTRKGKPRIKFKSKYVGVSYWQSATGRKLFYGRVYVNGRNIICGSYATTEREAALNRDKVIINLKLHLLLQILKPVNQ